MSQNLDELHTLVRQLRNELSWAVRTGIQVAPPTVPPPLDDERPAADPFAPVAAASPEATPDPFAPAEDPFAASDPEAPAARGLPPPKREAHPKRPWEAYIGDGDASESPKPEAAEAPPVAEAPPLAEAPPAPPPRAEPPPPAPPPRADPPPPPGPPPRAEPPTPAPRAEAPTPRSVSSAPPGTSTLPVLHRDLLACRDLDGVREVLGPCVRCKLSGQGRQQIVFGVGDPSANLMFVGEGPGREEDRRGEPFVGEAGQLLTRIVEGGMGLKRSDVYIANIVKCRPPQNRDPEPDEVEACEPFLLAQIRLIQPQVIVSLGKYASQTLLRSKTPISRLRGQWHHYNGIPLMPTFHPAYVLRNPASKREVWADIQEVMKFMGLDV